MTLAPLWLQRLSDISPFKLIVAANRAVFRGEIASFSVTIGLARPVALLLLSLWPGTGV
jgi:hypothetical protein